MKKIGVFICLVLLSFKAFSMHIAEGFLPKEWAAFWVLVFLPFLITGFRNLKNS